ncbi:MAG: hypothetical protein ABIJ16_09000 [Bacteroidota bacterium]
MNKFLTKALYIIVSLLCRVTRLKKLTRYKIVLGAGLISLLVVTSCRTKREHVTCYAKPVDNEQNIEDIY